LQSIALEDGGEILAAGKSQLHGDVCYRIIRFMEQLLGAFDPAPSNTKTV
jgi:hypothetical protein